MKHYLSISSSAPSERLTKIALENRDKLLSRTCAIVDQNLPKLDAFFARHERLFAWRRPDGSCMAFPRYLGADGVENFARNLIEQSGVLLLPGTIYSSELAATPADRFRIGFGRRDIDDGLAAMEAYLNGL